MSDDHWMDENGWIPADERLTDAKGRQWRVRTKQNQILTKGGMNDWTIINAKRAGVAWYQFALIPTANPDDMWTYVADLLSLNGPNLYGHRND